MINTTDVPGNPFRERQAKDLPLEGRNVPDLLTLQPGVAYTGNRSDTSSNDTRSGAVNGARSDQGNPTLDGIRVNDEGGHAFTAVLPVTLDSVQEFRVTTTNANADEGGTSGAQVALVSESGTDQFHGSLYEYDRNTYECRRLLQQDRAVSELHITQCEHLRQKSTTGDPRYLSQLNQQAHHRKTSYFLLLELRRDQERRTDRQFWRAGSKRGDVGRCPPMALHTQSQQKLEYDPDLQGDRAQRCKA